MEFLCHDINVHVPHHVNSKIPWYNLRAATDSLRRNWGEVSAHPNCFLLTTVDSRTLPLSCGSVLQHCLMKLVYNSSSVDMLLPALWLLESLCMLVGSIPSVYLLCKWFA